MGKKTQDFSKK